MRGSSPRRLRPPHAPVVLVRDVSTAGTIAETGTGLVQLEADDQQPGGGLIDLQSDGGIDGNAGTLNNAGTLRKSGGTGTSTVGTGASRR